VLALRDQIAPATLNLDNPDDAAQGIDLIRGAARPMKIEHVMSNGFGFGGVNASVLFKAWNA
jgi:3-oxoacyl-[acyl-carrier-protein] synthase II